MPLHSLLSNQFDSAGNRDELLQILSSVMDVYPVASFMIDSAHRVIHWNRACEVLTGVKSIDIVGTWDQGKVFYGANRPVMADLVLQQAENTKVDSFYHGKFKKSKMIPGTYEAEDFFSHFGEDGRWLYFTASKITGSDGRVLGAIETLQDVTERYKAERDLRITNEKLTKLSRIDDLTRLFNARYFHEILHDEYLRAQRYEQPLSILIFDLDFFKRVNDTYGHQEGDRVLRLVATQLNQWKRETDFAFRFGGDEFAVILPNTAGLAAESAAKRLMGEWSALALQSPVQTLGCTLSIGVTQLLHDESIDHLVRRADQASYEAKRLGRAQVVAA